MAGAGAERRSDWLRVKEACPRPRDGTGGYDLLFEVPRRMIGRVAVAIPLRLGAAWLRLGLGLACISRGGI